MRKLIGSFIFGSLLITGILLFLPQKAEACRPGEVYAEGTSVLFCWGQNGDDCAKCVDAKKIK